MKSLLCIFAAPLLTFATQLVDVSENSNVYHLLQQRKHLSDNIAQNEYLINNQRTDLIRMNNETANMKRLLNIFEEATKTALQTYDSKVKSVMYWEPQSGTACGAHAVDSLLQEYYLLDGDKQDELLDKAANELNINRGKLAKGINTYLDDKFVLWVMKNKGYPAIEVTRDIQSNQMLPPPTPERTNGYLIAAPCHFYALRKIDGQWYNLNSNPGCLKKINENITTKVESLLKEGFNVIHEFQDLPERHYDPLLHNGAKILKDKKYQFIDSKNV